MRRSDDTSTMVNLAPVFPLQVLIAYFATSSLALTLCLVAFVAIYRTRKTPYSTKLLAMGLLFYDSMFLISAGICKLFSYNDIFIAQNLVRGFQIAAQIIVAVMACERLLVLNWPYIYLRVATDRLVKNICLGVIATSFLQYVAFRGLACYSVNRFMYCGKPMSFYYSLLSFLLPVLSFISFGKIYKIIHRKRSGPRYGKIMTQYKGTVVSFVYLINSAFVLIVYFGLSVAHYFVTINGLIGDGQVSALADCVNVVSCIIDPLIYVIWFKETQMEVLKMIKVCSPFARANAEAMRIDIFNIITVKDTL